MMSVNGKRVAKNTMMLYIRMLLIMAVSLYTSRIVLKVLGVEDFGIYNIVAGIVVLFSFLNSAMSSATQRFLSFELGRGDINEVRRVFSMSMTAHISIALLILLFAETVGLWFLNTQINIPVDRVGAANWVYQFSILTFCIQIIRVPYNASIIAYERMTFYAYISIIEVVLKLLIVFLLVYFDFDKLKIYSVLIFLITLVICLSFKYFCCKTFPICRYNFFWNASLYKKIMSFSGWSLFGSVANVGSQQGMNILLNIFYGVSINAAMGIANQVSQAVYNFVSNFQIAFNPQIIKSYASNNKDEFIKLIFQTSRFSYFLLLLISLPVLINTKFILQVWLTNIPVYTVVFCRLIITSLLIDAIAAPLWISVQATGQIRNYQILISFIILSNLPLLYFALKLGYSPESGLVIRVLVNIITLIVRIIYLKTKIGLPVFKYFYEVIFILIVVSVCSFPLPFYVSLCLSSWNGLILSILVGILSSSFFIYFIGLQKNEKYTIKRIVLKKINKLKK